MLYLKNHCHTQGHLDLLLHYLLEVLVLHFTNSLDYCNF